MLLTDAVVHHNYPSALLPPPFAVVDLALGFSTFLCRLERPARVITDGGSKSDSNRAAQHRPTQTQLSHGPARLTVKNLGRRHRNTSTPSVSDPCSLAFTSSLAHFAKPPPRRNQRRSSCKCFVYTLAPIVILRVAFLGFALTVCVKSPELRLRRVDIKSLDYSTAGSFSAPSTASPVGEAVLRNTNFGGSSSRTARL